MTMSFTKGHFYSLCCSNFSYATCLTSLKTLIIQIMVMTVRYSEDKNTGFIVNDLEQSLSIIFMWLHDSHKKTLAKIIS